MEQLHRCTAATHRRVRWRWVALPGRRGRPRPVDVGARRTLLRDRRGREVEVPTEVFTSDDVARLREVGEWLAAPDERA